MEKVHFRAKRCKNYRFYRKMLQIKWYSIKFSVKNLMDVYLSTPVVELETPKICILEILYALK